MSNNNVIIMIHDVASLAEPGTDVTLTEDSTVREAFAAFGTFLAHPSHQITGGTTANPNAAGQLLTHDRPDDRLSRLSSRELDVLALMADGLRNATIADRLFITEGGVHKHIRNIFAKLDLSLDDRVDRRVAAVLRYLKAVQQRQSVLRHRLTTA